MSGVGLLCLRTGWRLHLHAQKLSSFRLGLGVNSLSPLYMCGTNIPHSVNQGFSQSVATTCHNSRDSGSQKDHHSSRWKSYGTFGGLTLGAAAFFLATYFDSQRTKDWIRELKLRGEDLLPCAHCATPDSGHRRSKQYNFLAQAVETAAPSVVCIEKKEAMATLFGDAVSVSSGSGFIVDKDGYVLTNAHVVANARHVRVKLHSGRVVDGDVTDIDEVADLALVKLNIPSGETLPALEFGSSAELRPGEWVVALGSPLSLSNTITAGIVSSVLRPSKELGLQHYKPDMEYVQTDAPITIGNSGGPLVNLDGEVIGVNTMTAGPGISFAIPSDFARSFLKTANRTVKQKTKGKFAIGISMLSVTPKVIRSTMLRTTLPKEVSHGVFLANVWPNGAAAKGGLQRGDVIVRINGQEIHSSNQVYELVQSGKSLTMEVVRGVQWKTFTVHPEPLYSS